MHSHYSQPSTQPHFFPWMKMLRVAHTMRKIKIRKLYYIIFGISVVMLVYGTHQSLISMVSSRLFVMKPITWQELTNYSHDPMASLNGTANTNSIILWNRIFHHDGVAYDFYSKEDLNRSSAGIQWKIWPLPHETESSLPSDNSNISPLIVSNLSFVHSIYLLSNRRLVERHDNLRKAFHHQGPDFQSIDWRMRWNRTTCNSEFYHSHVYQRLNLNDTPLSNSICCNNIAQNEKQQRTCAVTMEHVDVWYEMAEKKIPLGLILEDDAILVPFFKEKFTRMIYAALDKKILRLDGICFETQNETISVNETVHQNPMIVIGTCLGFHDSSFQRNLSTAPPLLTPHKSNPSRCSHAYLLTSCSAQALIDQIRAQKNDHQPSDLLQDQLFPPSPTLQSFWMDPPLVYQGNQVIDRDNLSTFAVQTYKAEN